VVDEVAGEYIGHRAVTVWNSWKRLETLGIIQHSVSKGKLTVDAAKKLILNSLPIPVEYDRAMQRIYFGYQPVSGGRQSKVMKAIYSGLLPYCDGLLENKISLHFNQMRQLRVNFETMLKSMRRFPPLAEAMLHTNYPRSYSIGH
jgi:hypothetical protein